MSYTEFSVPRILDAHTGIVGVLGITCSAVGWSEYAGAPASEILFLSGLLLLLVWGILSCSVPVDSSEY